jgi:hypothetical protein
LMVSLRRPIDLPHGHDQEYKFLIKWSKSFRKGICFWIDLSYSPGIAITSLMRDDGLLKFVNCELSINHFFGVDNLHNSQLIIHNSQLNIRLKKIKLIPTLIFK